MSRPKYPLLRSFLALVWLLSIQGAGAAAYFTPTTATWKLLRGLSEASTPTAGWRQVNFDDGGWEDAPAPIFYSSAATEAPFYNGGAFSGTTLTGMQNNYSCVFLRKTFVVATPGAISQLILEAAVDDGFIAWLNGVEVARTNIFQAAPPFDALADTAIAEPAAVANFTISNPAALLVVGTNVLAVQVFNAALDSTDLGFMAGLSSPNDATPPTVASQLPPAGMRVGDLTQIEVAFSEAVSNVTAGDLLINGVPATSVTAGAADRYRFGCAQPEPGVVTVTWAAGHEIRDLAGNEFAGGGWTYALEPGAMTPPAMITEFMAANVSTLADEDGDFSDWLEVFNPRFTALNLGGWFLTDDPDRLNRWSFPTTNLSAGGRLLVFASGKNRPVAGRPLHTDFQLSSEGEFLALVKPDGTIVSSFGPGLSKQRRDISYGLVAGTSTNGFLETPTPGTANVAGTAEFVADTKFSHDRGFYSASFDLVISCATPGATIYYTTNGLPPGPGNGPAYAGPIRISRTTTVRAGAVRPGARASNMDTHTYLFLAEVMRQSLNGQPPPGWPATWGDNDVDYGMDPDIVTRLPWSGTISNDLRAIPTLSLVMRLEDLFDADTGIYANPLGEGREWERPGSIELIYPDGREGFQLDAGVRLRGGFSRALSNPKHSLRILCRDDYGPARLRFPLFGPTGAESFDRFDLRTSQDGSYAFLGDRDGLFLSDPFVRDTLLATGQPGERGDWFHLYLNGQYWGLYNTAERPEANFAASYFGGGAGDYDVLKPDPDLGYVMKPTDGDNAAWTRLWQAAKNGFAANSDYFRVQGRNADGSPNTASENLLDVTNLVDYLLTVIYAGDFDGPIYGALDSPDSFVNNYYAFRSRQNTGGFRFVAHDAELSIQSLDENRAGTTSLGSDSADHLNPHYLATRLRANAEFKMFFADRVQKHFFNGGAMTPEAAMARFSARTNELHRAITGESARWGDAKQPTSPITRQDWLDAVSAKLTDYFPYRTEVVLDQLRAEHLFPSVAAPQLTPAGGEVPFGTAITLSHTNPGGAIYYTLDGSDPRAIGGGIRGSALSYMASIAINSSRIIRARVKSSTTWSPLIEATFYPAQDFSGLRLTEIMFHPPNAGLVSGDEFEFLELKNAGVNPLDLGGAYFTGIGFTFTNGTRLVPGGFFVLARNPAQLASRHPGLAVNGVFTGHLDNSGERITLRTAPGAEILSVNYSDRAPWPVAADGQGFSVVPLNPAGAADLDDGLQWRASRDPGGSPGEDDPPSTLAPIRINEILTHTDPPQTDAVELFNPSAAPVDLSGWYLTDEPGAPRKFRIPGGTTIAAGGYRVFDETDFNPGGAGFALKSTGDAIYLFSGSPSGTNLTGYSHGARLGAAANGVSFGRYLNSAGEEQFPAQLTTTFGAANSGPRVGPAVINEMHYHPGADGDEYVEVINISDAALPLFDPARPVNTWRVNGLGFVFPPNITLPAGGLALVVRMEPAAFRAKYSVSGAVPVFGPFSGQLQDSGERLELQRPDAPDTNGVVPYITVDAVRYNDHAPWPVAADGDGASLQRLLAFAYADDPTNWYAGDPTPGWANQKPAILMQPQDQSVPSGTDVAFSVAALGNPLRYQWHFNTAALPGETNDTLVLNNVSVARAGGYRVVVSDADSSVTSRVATLTVTCGFALSQTNAWFTAGGGAGEVSVFTQSDCGWSIVGLPDWMTLTSADSGNGRGSITYSVAENSGTTVRRATLLIAGRSHLVTQSPVDAKAPTITMTRPLSGARITNDLVTVAGTAKDEIGVLRVDCRAGPGEFLAAGGTTSWSAEVRLVAGTNFIRARSVDLAGNYSATNVRSVFCAVPSPLSLVINGRGGVTGATNGQPLEVGRGYTLTATPASGFIFSNWTGGLSATSPKVTFLMQSNLVATANFVTNPFIAVAGGYHGLFYESDAVRHGSSGFFSFTVTERGSYTASLLTGGRKRSASGRLSLAGAATNVIPRPGTNALTVTWHVALDGSDQTTGRVTDGDWSADLIGDRAVFDTRTNPCTNAGKYTFVLPGTPGPSLVPGGDSYGTVSIGSNGVASLKGYFGDATAGAQKVSLSKNGDWPFYLPLYSARGSVLSWLRLTNRVADDFHGLTSWTRPAISGAKYCPGGFVVVTNLTGSHYTAPIGATNRILNLTEAAVTFQGGDLPQPYTNKAILGLSGSMTNEGPGQLSLSFRLSSGLFSGAFTPTGATHRVSFKGAVLQKATNAAGFFRGTNQTGRVSIEPSP